MTDCTVPARHPRDGAEAAQRTPGSPGSQFTCPTQEDRLSTRAGSGPSVSRAQAGALPVAVLCVSWRQTISRSPARGPERAPPAEPRSGGRRCLGGRPLGTQPRKGLCGLCSGTETDAGLCRECARALPPSATRPALSRALTLAHQTSGRPAMGCVSSTTGRCALGPALTQHPGPGTARS